MNISSFKSYTRLRMFAKTIFRVTTKTSFQVLAKKIFRVFAKKIFCVFVKRDADSFGTARVRVVPEDSPRYEEGIPAGARHLKVNVY